MKKHLDTSDKSLDKSLMSSIKLIDKSINDWPNNVSSLDDYIIQLEAFVGEELTLENVRNRMRNLDFSQHAWQAESLSHLIEVFGYFPGEPNLTDILNIIRKHISV